MNHLIYLRITNLAMAALATLMISQPVTVGHGKSSKTFYGTISQIVQTRNHRKSCWGVVIRLKKLHFRDSVTDAELAITEAKHSSDLRPLMAWHVGKSKQTLTIEFKPGMRDFGTGNYATIHIDGSAMVGSPKGGLEFDSSTELN